MSEEVVKLLFSQSYCRFQFRTLFLNEHVQFVKAFADLVFCLEERRKSILSFIIEKENIIFGDELPSELFYGIGVEFGKSAGAFR